MICWTPAGNADAPEAREKYRAPHAPAINPCAAVLASSRILHAPCGATSNVVDSTARGCTHQARLCRNDDNDAARRTRAAQRKSPPYGGLSGACAAR
jgi:hypothetical protein